MAIPAFPGWLGWLLILAVIILWFQVGRLQSIVGDLTSGRPVPRNRQDLEAAYAAGQMNRDDYEKWKDRVK